MLPCASEVHAVMYESWPQNARRFPKQFHFTAVPYMHGETEVHGSGNVKVAKKRGYPESRLLQCSARARTFFEGPESIFFMPRLK